MSQGYYVYFPMNMDNPFDIAAYKNTQFYRIEVKSLNFAPIYNTPSFGWPAAGQVWDRLIVVHEDGRCFSFDYNPQLNYSDCIDSIRRELDLPAVYRSKLSP